MYTIADICILFYELVQPEARIGKVSKIALPPGQATGKRNITKEGAPELIIERTSLKR